MTDRPILFSGEMVRALLAGRKTQTRRVLNPQPTRGYKPWQDEDTGHWFISGYGEAGDWDLDGVRFVKGDRLWVRERCITITGGQYHGVRYIADGTDKGAFNRASEHGQWDAKSRPSIHMPRWASRLTLGVTDVRVQRLQEISEADAEAEGVEPILVPPDGGGAPHVEGYRDLWDRLNAKRGFGWGVNPWVVAVTSTVEQRNIDA